MHSFIDMAIAELEAIFDEAGAPGPAAPEKPEETPDDAAGPAAKKRRKKPSRNEAVDEESYQPEHMRNVPADQQAPLPGQPSAPVEFAAEFLANLRGLEVIRASPAATKLNKFSHSVEIW